jgi:uncharacterized protein YacL
MARHKMNIAVVIGALNSLLLAYAIWIKHSPTRCYICHQTTFLPVSDQWLAIMGMAMSLILSVLMYWGVGNKRISYLTLTIAGISAGVSSYLAIGQFVSRNICYLCLSGDIGFVVLFASWAKISVIEPLWTRLKLEETQ